MRKMGAMKMASKMMRRMAKKKSIVGKKRSVFSGTKVKTVGGLKKSDLIKNKRGKVVSKKASFRSKNSKNGKKIAAWGNAVKAARKALGIKGFLPVGGKTPAGRALLAKVRSFYRK